jgi:ABC-2 type transport system permease protein
MKVLAIVTNELRRTLRWRANVFFLLIMPMMVILLLGVAFGNQNAVIGVTGSKAPLATKLTKALNAQPGLDIRRYGDEKSLEKAVERGYVTAGLVIPANYDSRLASGRSAKVEYSARPGTLAQQVQVALEAAVAAQGSVLSASRAVQQLDHVTFASALGRVEAVKAAPNVTVALEASDGGKYPGTAGQFEQGASTQLILFVFLSALTGSVWLIETRKLGVARRMLSTPTSSRTILFGIVLGRWVIALVQALLIVVFSALVFSVNWGDPLGTAAVIISFSLVAVGAGVLIGTIFSNPQQAAPVGMITGLVFAALGGSMEPLQYFPHTVRTFAHVIPHAWANDAFDQLLGHSAGFTAVLPNVAILLGYAAVLLTLATWRLRRALTT